MSIASFMFSDRQQRVLRTLILKADEQFSVSDLLRVAGPGNGATQRILDTLEDAGIVHKTARGNQRLYAINRENPIYPELRSICLKTFGLADVIAEELAPFKDRIDTAFVFGSIAKNQDRPGSDIDLMVVGDLDVFDLGESVERLQKTLGRIIDLNLHTRNEWKALENDRVVLTILKDAKIMVVGQ
jgi:predicted nucleotidyltransferase